MKTANLIMGHLTMTQQYKVTGKVVPVLNGVPQHGNTYIS